MNTKCGGCGKFISSTGPDSAQCTKCSVCFHRACVMISATSKISRSWVCPGCKRQIPRGDNSSTPVKAAEGRSPSPERRSYLDPAIASHSASGEVGDSPAIGIYAMEIKFFREELLSLKLAFKEEIQGMRVELRQEMRDMRVELGEFKASLQSCHERIDSIDVRIVKIEEKIAAVPEPDTLASHIVDDLRDQLNERDQELLRNDVEISGVPEGSDDATHILKLLATKLSVELDDRDIVHVERIGLKRFNDRPANDSALTTRPRNIAVRFARRCTRDQLLQAARVRRNITSADIEQAGAPRRIYLNERLSRTNRGLFARAREAGRKAQYRYVWTREGRIYARQADGRPAERIRADADIDKIFHA